MANDINQLLAYPIITDIDYASNINSKNLNLMLKSIEESILRAIIKGAEIENKYNMLSLATNVSYSALSRSHQIYDYYPKSLDIPSGEYGGIGFASAFGAVSGVRQESAYGLVTMDWEKNKKLSKIPIYNGIVSPTVEIYVDDELRSPGDPVYNVIDGDNSTFWVETTTSGLHSLELILPPSTQKTFNYIQVVPFPIFGIEITRIEYTDFQSIPQTIYPTTDTSFYNNSGPLVLHLEPREYNNSIKIYFEVLEEINAMGFSSIDIASIDYSNNTNTVYLKFENIMNTDHLGNTVTNIRPIAISLDFYADGNANDYNSFISEISLVSTSTENPQSEIALAKKREKQTINCSSFNVEQGSGENNALWLKVVMNEVNLTTPVFRGAKLEYREVE